MYFLPSPAHTYIMKNKRSTYKRKSKTPVLPHAPTRSVNYTGETDDDRKFD